MLREQSGCLSQRRAVAFAVVSLLLATGAMAAEPALLVYPSTLTILRYDAARYELLSPGDPDYEAQFAIGDRMLWDKVEQRVPTEIYRAPQLGGFEQSWSGRTEFVAWRNEFDLIVDGHFDTPRFLGNLHVRFVPVPAHAIPEIEVDDVALTDLVHPIGDLNVTTPTGDGYYADTLSREIRWRGAIGLRIVVFSDKNMNGVFDDGPPLFSVLAEDHTIPVEPTTWGALKALYD